MSSDDSEATGAHNLQLAAQRTRTINRLKSYFPMKKFIKIAESDKHLVTEKTDDDTTVPQSLSALALDQ